jgi:hypothetical protein
VVVEVHQVVLERTQEVRAEPAAVGIQPGQEVLPEEVQEKALHGVLGRRRRHALSPQEEVDGLPVRRAELLEQLWLDDLEPFH